MRNTCSKLALSAVLAGLVSGTAVAQDKTVEEMKKEADLELVRANIATANQKLLTDALAAAKQPREGSATLTGADATAEGLILSDYVVKRTAFKLASDVKEWQTKENGSSEPLLVVFGSSAPSVAQWIAFEKMIRQLQDGLKTATDDWDKLTARPTPTDGPNLQMMVDPLTTGALVMGLVSTAASLFKTDFVIGGTKLTPTNDELRASVLAALAQKGIRFDTSQLEIASKPENVENAFKALEPLQRKAYAQYHDGYLPLLKSKGGKVENLTSDEQAAGKNLLTALTDHQTLYKAVYTPVNDILPATVLEFQKGLFDRGQRQPILYVFSTRANLTTVTKKSLFTGIQSTPAFFRAVGAMDYGIVSSGTTRLRSASHVTPQVPFDKATLFLAQGFAEAEPDLVKKR